jgi:creatinine amidohydrolase
MLFSSETYQTLQDARNKVVLLPLGATEQHGPHLAVGTDTDIVTRIAVAAEQQRSTDIVLFPTLPFGSSHHHLSFGGTISLPADLYTRVVTDLVKSLVQYGFRRIVLFNGHGGNITPVKQALAMLDLEYNINHHPNIALATYWELAGSYFTGQSPMESPALSHACEYETSLMLHLFPNKVWMNRVERAKKPPQNGYIAWEDDIPYQGVTLFKSTAFISSNGSSGEPQLATKEKGAHLFKKAVEALVRFLDSFQAWPFMQPLT